MNIPQKTKINLYKSIICIAVAAGAALSATAATACLGHPGQKCGGKETLPADEIRAEILQQPTLDERGNAMALKLSFADNTPVTLDKLKTVHTKKIHLLVIDDSLTDYHHLHPEVSDKVGMYNFVFKPNTAHSYRVFTDITPVNGSQRFLISDIKGAAPCESNCITHNTPDTKTLEGFTYSLTSDKELKVGKDSMLTLTISEPSGNSTAPVKRLEPVMGAYAHLVGFYENRKTIAHIHPMGKEPEKESDRGDGVLTFHFKPQRAGFVNFFAQVLIDGKMRFIPFGYEVK